MRGDDLGGRCRVSGDAPADIHRSRLTATIRRAEPRRPSRARTCSLLLPRRADRPRVRDARRPRPGAAYVPPFPGEPGITALHLACTPGEVHLRQVKRRHPVAGARFRLRTVSVPTASGRTSRCSAATQQTDADEPAEHSPPTLDTGSPPQVERVTEAARSAQRPLRPPYQRGRRDREAGSGSDRLQCREVGLQTVDRELVQEAGRSAPGSAPIDRGGGCATAHEGISDKDK